MKGLFPLLLAAALLAAGPALAQEQGRGAQMQKQGMQPGGDRAQRHERDEMRDRHRERGGRERLSREERKKLRQDLLDANREMKGRR